MYSHIQSKSFLLCIKSPLNTSAFVVTVLMLIFMCSATSSSVINAKPAYINGFPCVAEVCIGDDPLNLSVHWESTKDFKCDVVSCFKIDDKMIAKMRNYGIQCEQPRFRQKDAAAGEFAIEGSAEWIGVFKSASGYPTRVKIMWMVSKEDVLVQRFVVTEIQRTFVGVERGPRQDQLVDSLKKRYEPSKFNDIVNEKTRIEAYEKLASLKALVSVAPAGSRDSENVTLIFVPEFGNLPWTIEDFMYKKHPECGGRGNDNSPASLD